MKVAAVMLIIAAIVGAYLVIGPRDREPSLVSRPAPSDAPSGSRSLHADAVLSIAPGRERAGAAGRTEKPRLSTVMQEYADATSLRPLFDRLRMATARTPEESYILAEILDRCGKITDRKPSVAPGNFDEEDRKRLLATISPRDPDGPKRIAAYDRVPRKRCEGFEGVESTRTEVRALLEQAASDPKAQARLVEKDVYATMPPGDGPVYGPDGKSRLPTISDAQLQLLLRAAQSGDPSAISIAGHVLGSTLDNLTVRTGPDDKGIDPRAWSDAWRLAACDMGAPCGADSAMLLNACARQANCGAEDLREYLFFFEHSPQQSQRLQDYEQHLLAAIQSGDWSYFNFQRAPPPRGWVMLQLSP